MSSPNSPSSHTDDGGPPLSGRVSSRLLLLLLVGDILGAGIYVLVGELAGEIGSMGWLAFAVAFGLALASATSYGEMVTRFPGAAGSALYAREAFASPTITAMVGIAVLVSTLATSATTARAFAGDYLGEFVELPTTPVALLVVLVLVFIASLGIETSSRANAALAIVETLGLVLVVVVGVAAVGDGSGDGSALVDTSELDSAGVLGATALAFFAFLGFEDGVHLSEEVDDPRVFPRVLIGAVLVTGTVYVAVAVTAGLLVEPDVLASSDGPLLEVIRAGPVDLPARLFAAIALGAVTNTSLFTLVAASRLLYGMARAGDLPAPLGRTWRRRGSPLLATITCGAIAASLAATGAVDELARTAVTALLAVLAVVNLSAIRTRSRPSGWRPPSWVAWTGLAASAGLFANEVVTADLDHLVRLASLTALGVAARLLRPRPQQPPRPDGTPP